MLYIFVILFGHDVQRTKKRTIVSAFPLVKRCFTGLDTLKRFGANNPNVRVRAHIRARTHTYTHAPIRIWLGVSVSACQMGVEHGLTWCYS